MGEVVWVEPVEEHGIVVLGGETTDHASQDVEQLLDLHAGAWRLLQLLGAHREDG